jgi:hypothetical protein
MLPEENNFYFNICKDRFKHIEVCKDIGVLIQRTPFYFRILEDAGVFNPAMV